MTTPSIEQQLHEILTVLSVPPTSEEEIDGWSNESKNAAYKYFSELHTAFASGATLPPLGIVRGLDHWGVVGGELLESIARVTNQLRRVSGVE